MDWAGIDISDSMVQGLDLSLARATEISSGERAAAVGRICSTFKVWI